eukprot:UN0122
MARGSIGIINGPTGDHVTIELQLKDELTVVRVKSAIQGMKTWTSKDNDNWHEFFISRRAMDWDVEPMRRVDASRGEYRCTVTLGDSGIEDFQFLMDRDMEKLLYPHRGFAGLAEGAVCGPDSNGDMLCWRLSGRPGHVYEVALNVHHEDPLKMVWWRKIIAELELTDS